MAETVNADMSANVWKIVVAAGDAVDTDDTLLILESMKMEIPVLAESDGVITDIHVTEGATVNAGDPLVTIDDS